MTEELLKWLGKVCESYKVQPYAIYRATSETSTAWPLSANNSEDLLKQLQERGHFLPLPQEPAALANILEVSIADHVLDELKKINSSVGVRGGERAYPDLEVSADVFGGGPFAVDIKVARRSKSGRQTDSRVTLYTGNTYFRHPDLKWPGTLRSFNEYKNHLTLIVLYTLDTSSVSRVTDIKVIVQETWRIASRQRSSTTREYIGAVVDIGALSSGKGEFASKSDFYKYWRNYPFKIGKTVEKQFMKLIAAGVSAKSTTTDVESSDWTG
ncbi:type II restriction endonuclease [Burkholderia gladioli]|uniref:type II restriction endonuclease n=1 Tax=Burkholderia gladioli TaxID=28095 RepID=UPI00163F37A0|nr:type II restriction endonuclease [Burkholderia gladioli]